MENRSLNTAYEGLSEERSAVPVLKLPGKTSRDGALLTPRSLEAAEKAVADIETIATEREEEAAGFGRSGIVTDRYALEAEARMAASQLWWCWILYHEQRGARTEVDSGGVGFTHYMVRRHVSKATADAVNKTLGGQATFYGQNY